MSVSQTFMKQKHRKNVTYLLIFAFIIVSIFAIICLYYSAFNYNGPTSDDQNTAVSLRLVCYYIFNASYLVPENVDYSLCTHLLVGFASINSNNYSISISLEDSAVLRQIILLNRKQALTMISIGGAGDESFSRMVLNHKNRKSFIRSLMEFIKEYHLDGVDLDWEWPVLNGSPQEKVHFIQLLYEIRVEFERHKKKYFLTAAVAAVQTIIDAVYYVGHMAEHVDFVNIMSYDYHVFTRITPMTDYNSPLYPNEADGSGIIGHLNVNYTAHHWLKKGMPRNKMVLGIPSYGHTFRLRNSANHGRHAPAESYGFGENGFATMPEICSFISSPFAVVVRDNISKVPYAYDSHFWVSYEDALSLRYKVQFAKDLGLGGVMVFSLNADDYAGSCKYSGTFPVVRSVLSYIRS